MTQETEDEQKVIKFARYCGAEARANKRKNMDGDDREDIADKAGYSRWVDMPIELRNDSIAAFYSGWKDEKQVEKSF